MRRERFTDDAVEAKMRCANLEHLAEVKAI